MNKKWLLLPIGIILAVGIYFFYLMPPSKFLGDQQVIDEMNFYGSGFVVEKVLEKIEVDEHHYFVPFLSDTDEPGMSFWKWHKGKWQLVKFTINNQPLVWQLDDKEPHAIYIVWHIPIEQTSNIKLYGVRERNLHSSSSDGHFYVPRIQLAYEISTTQLYGIEQIPHTWGNIMNEITAFNSPRILDWMSPDNIELTFFMEYPEDFFGLDNRERYDYYTGNADSTFSYIPSISKCRLE